MGLPMTQLCHVDPKSENAAAKVCNSRPWLWKFQDTQLTQHTFHGRFVTKLGLCFQLFVTICPNKISSSRQCPELDDGQVTLATCSHLLSRVQRCASERDWHHGSFALTLKITYLLTVFRSLSLWITFLFQNNVI